MDFDYNDDDIPMGEDDSTSGGEDGHRLVGLGDLRLNEHWGADENDLRLFKALGRFFSGEAGSRAHAFPGFVKGTEPYRALISRGTVGDGNKAKVLLAIVMELDKIEHLSAAQYIGTLVDNSDPGLDVIKTIIVPMLVEDLSIYAGWEGYHLPMEADAEREPQMRKRAIMDYTKGWIMTKLGEDPYMTHFVQRIEDEMLEEAMSKTMATNKDS